MIQWNLKLFSKDTKSITICGRTPFPVSSLDSSHNLSAPALELWVTPSVLHALSPPPLHVLLCSAEKKVLPPHIHLANTYSTLSLLGNLSESPGLSLPFHHQSLFTVPNMPNYAYLCRFATPAVKLYHRQAMHSVRLGNCRHRNRAYQPLNTCCWI